MVKGIIVILGLAGLYFLAQKYSLFYIFHYFDSILHVLGGIGIGLFFATWWVNRPLRIFSITLTLAILWEIFERVGHYYLPVFINFGGIADTSMDILCAILGASLVILATRE